MDRPLRWQHYHLETQNRKLIFMKNYSAYKLNFLVLIVYSSIFFIPTSVFAQTKNDKSVQISDTLTNFTVEQAPEWTNLFYQTNGWFGADGIFSFTPNGDESIGAGKGQTNLLTFSDTMTGTVLEDSVEGFKMVNNSIAYVDGTVGSKETVDILVNKNKEGSFINYFEPNTPNTGKKDYYWFGDGFVNHAKNNDLYIFGYRTIDHSEASWDFEIIGTTLVIIPSGSKPPFKNQRQIDAPLMIERADGTKGTIGSGVYVNTKEAGAPNPDGFVYVYGLVDPNKQLVVARFKPEHVEGFKEWSYWNGENWGTEINEVATITNRVSNEVSLTALKDGRYLLVFQADGIGEYVAIRIGETPIGPFGPLQKIWHVPEITEPPGIIPYNAKAHPILSSDKDGLLISYNTITMDYFNDILKFPHSYRPRFIRLKIN